MFKLNTNKLFTNQSLEPIRDTDIYTVTDNNYLKNLTTSETVLHANKHASEHKHDGLDEVYIFLEGIGRIQIDESMYDISPGDIYHVNGGEFHKVYNDNDTDLRFIAICQKYDREENKNDIR